MYFSEFDSYAVALREADTVAIEVTTTDGQNHLSSSIPISAVSGVISDLEDFYGSKTVLMIWNKDKTELVSFAYERVISVRLRLLKKRS